MLIPTLTHLVLREVAANATTSATSTGTDTCVTGVPDKNGYVAPGDCNSNYNYNPSFIAAVIFSILYGFITIAHITQARIYRKTFCWVLIMGCIWETASFIVRTLSTKNQQSGILVTISTLLLLLAPLWINAFDYMVLGRLINFLLPSQRMFNIKAVSLAKLFVWLDILSFVVQLGGGLLISGTNIPPKQAQIGTHIYMGGIGLQQFFIIIFFAFAIGLHRQCLADEKNGAFAGTGKEKWRRPLIMLYVSLTLITIRIIYRLCEFSKGFGMNNPVIFHESYLYALDALPLFLATLIQSVLHPGQFLQGPNSEFPKVTRKQKKANKLAAKEAKKEAKMMKKYGKSDSEGNIRDTQGISYGRVSLDSREEHELDTTRMV